MINFNDYISNSENSNSNFLNTVTVEEIKEAAKGQPFRVIPSKDKVGKYFFACGQIRGYVASKTAAKLAAKQPTDTMVVSEVVTKEGKKLLMLHEQSTGNAIAVF